MHAITYPVGHKKHPQRKASKDLTPEEWRSIEDQEKWYHGCRRSQAESVLQEIDDALRVMKDYD